MNEENTFMKCPHCATTALETIFENQTQLSLEILKTEIFEGATKRFVKALVFCLACNHFFEYSEQL